MSDFYTETQRKARKVHKCEMCSKEIQPGETYRHSAGVFEGEFFNMKTCEICNSLVGEMYDNKGYDFPDGVTENDMREYWQDERCSKCVHGDCTYGMTHYVRCDNWEVKV